MRLVRGAQAPGALSLRVLDRVPGPAVAVDERPRLVGSVGDVDADVRDLGIRLLEVCVGDRLALARASPRRPDVDEHRPSAEVGEGDPLAVDRQPFDRGRGRTVGSRRRAGRRRRLCRHRLGRCSFLLPGASSAPGGEQQCGQRERYESRESSHRSTVATPAGGPGRFQLSERLSRSAPAADIGCSASTRRPRCSSRALARSRCCRCAPAGNRELGGTADRRSRRRGSDGCVRGRLPPRGPAHAGRARGGSCEPGRPRRRGIARFSRDRP